MAITHVKIGAGYGLLAAGTAVITGLTQASFDKVQRRYLPKEQPASVNPQRICILEQTAPDTAQDLWGKPQSEWTIWHQYTTGGVVKEVLYNVVVLESRHIVADGDIHKYVTTLGMTEEELNKVLNRKDHT